MSQRRQSFGGTASRFRSGLLSVVHDLHLPPVKDIVIRIPIIAITIRIAIIYCLKSSLLPPADLAFEAPGFLWATSSIFSLTVWKT